MKRETIIFFASVLLALLVGIALGYYYGNRTGMEEGRLLANEQFSKIVHSIFPEPPEEIYSISGEVVSITGSAIKMEIISPEDYLPHTDGSPYEKENRYALVTANTEIYFINPSEIDENGSPSISKVSLSDLVAGDEIYVKSEENIREEERFEATRIEHMMY